jgi:hypothetical protein
MREEYSGVEERTCSAAASTILNNSSGLEGIEIYLNDNLSGRLRNELQS